MPRRKRAAGWEWSAAFELGTLAAQELRPREANPYRENVSRIEWWEGYDWQVERERLSGRPQRKA